MLNQPVITAPIIGANVPAQLMETLGGLEVQLADDEIHALSQLSEWRE
jgi:aryl-alcohol dehydrogenase-like predicted oxidoreductase